MSIAITSHQAIATANHSREMISRHISILSAAPDADVLSPGSRHHDVRCQEHVLYGGTQQRACRTNIGPTDCGEDGYMPTDHPI